MKRWDKMIRNGVGVVAHEDAEDIRKGNACKSLSIVSRAVNEAIGHRAETLCHERGITLLDRCDGDWLSEFVDTDNTMRALYKVMAILTEARDRA